MFIIEVKKEIEQAKEGMNSLLRALDIQILFARIFQHETCSPEIKSLIQFELKRIYEADNAAVKSVLSMDLTEKEPEYDTKFYVFHNHRGSLVFGFKCKYCGRENNYVDEREERHHCFNPECLKINRIKPIPNAR